MVRLRTSGDFVHLHRSVQEHHGNLVTKCELKAELAAFEERMHGLTFVVVGLFSSPLFIALKLLQNRASRLQRPGLRLRLRASRAPLADRPNQLSGFPLVGPLAGSSEGAWSVGRHTRTSGVQRQQGAAGSSGNAAISVEVEVRTADHGPTDAEFSSDNRCRRISRIPIVRCVASVLRHIQVERFRRVQLRTVRIPARGCEPELRRNCACGLSERRSRSSRPPSLP